MIISRGKVLKKLIGVFIIAGLLLSVQIAANAATTTDTITLTKAIDIAIANNLSLKLTDTKINNADLNLKYAEKLAINAAGKKWVTEEDHVSNLKEESLIPKQKYNLWKNLLLDKEQELVTLKQEVTENYYNVLLTEKSIVLNQNNINRIKKDIKSKTELLKRKLEKQQTIDELNTKLLEAEQTQSETIRQSDMAKLKLNMALGLPLESKLALTSERIDASEYIVGDLAGTIKTHIAKDNSYLKAIAAKEEAQLEYDLVRKNITRPSTDELERLADRLLDCNNNISEVSDSIELKIYTDYNNLLNLFDDIKINQYKYNLCIKQLESYKVKLKIGQISQGDYTLKYAEYESLGLILEKAKTDYQLAVEQFKAYVE